MRIRIYRNSVPASVCSLLAAFFGLGGIAMLFTMEIIIGLVMIVISVFLMIKADQIAERKRAKSYIEKLKENGFEPRIAASESVALEVYNGMANPVVLDYIATLNPATAEKIRSAQQEAAQKSGGRKS